jgi:hypothetical protein
MDQQSGHPLLAFDKVFGNAAMQSVGVVVHQAKSYAACRLHLAGLLPVDGFEPFGRRKFLKFGLSESSFDLLRRGEFGKLILAKLDPTAGGSRGLAAGGRRGRIEGYSEYRIVSQTCRVFRRIHQLYRTWFGCRFWEAVIADDLDHDSASGVPQPHLANQVRSEECN